MCSRVFTCTTKMVAKPKARKRRHGEESQSFLRIKKENDYIKRLIDTIPPRFYFDDETCGRLNANMQQRVQKKLGNRAKKNKLGKKLSVKTLYKRAKLDPGEHKSVTQIIQENENELEIVGEKTEKLLKISAVDLNQPLNREEVQQRIQEKIKMLRGNRAERSKDAQRECKRMKRRLSKIKLKEKRRLQKQAANTAATAQKPNDTGNLKPSFNKEGKMVFNKFEFSESGLPERKKSDVGKDFKTLLAKADKEKQKLEALKLQDPTKANDLREKKVWLNVMQKAEGVKLKDDPQLLKKGLKRKEQVKKKSKKQWETRENQVEQKMKAKQKKRQDNIKAKKQEAVKKKIKKAVKKGRYIPEIL